MGVDTSHAINIIGIKQDVDELNDFIRDNLPIFSRNIRNLISIKVTKFTLNKNSNVFALRVASLKKALYSIDNKVYLLKDKCIEEATPFDIEELVENNIISRINDYNTQNQIKFDNVINEVRLLKGDTMKFLLIHSIEKSSLTLPYITNTIQVERYSGEFPEDIENGSHTGNVFYTGKFEPRLPYAYLRYTCPRTDQLEIDASEAPRYTGDALIVSPGGGCFYIEHNDEWTFLSLDKYKPSLMLSKNKYKSISIKSLTGWLKSSLLMWYCYTALGSFNINDLSIFSKVPVPEIEIMAPGNEVEKIVSEISAKEYLFLSKLISMQDSNAEAEEIKQLINEHNNSINSYVVEIDKLFFKAYNLNDNDIEIIKHFFNSKHIYSTL